MKVLFWIGVLLLILGLASLVVPIPQWEKEGVKAGGISMEVQTRHDEKVPPYVSAVIILAAAGLMIAGKRKS
jgi:hypothetical protein